MELQYKLTDFSKKNEVLITKNTQVVFAQDGAGLSLAVGDGGISKDDFAKSNYVYFDVEVNDDLSVLLKLNFYIAGKEEPELYVLLGLLPQLKTRVCFDFAALEGNQLFWEPMSYNLKQVVFGAKLPKEEVVRIEISAAERLRPLNMTMSDVMFTDVLPTFEKTDKFLVDRYGQSPLRPTDTVVHTDEELCALMNQYKEEQLDDERYQQSAYGGSKTKKIDDGTGFFRTYHDGKRWWLVDPEGYLFMSSGIVCIAHNHAAGRIKGKEELYETIEPKDGPFAAAWSYRDNSDQYDIGVVNLLRAYGENYKEIWGEITYKRLKNWGINTVANWSDFDFARKYKMPYTLPIDKIHPFPTTSAKVFRDFPDVFDPTYESAATYYALALEPLKDDPCMIGYFMRNEPEWAFVENVCIAEQMLECSESLVSKDALIQHLQEKYKTVEALNVAWNVAFDSFDALKTPIRHAARLSDIACEDLRAFSEIMIRRYVEIPAKACRKIDPIHLNLGMRYAFITDPTLIAGWENFDVFSINSYTISPYSQIDEVSKFVDIPIMIGEFHFGSPESGMYATGLRAVPTQKERGIAYQYYMSEAMKHPYSVGAHYFTMYDQAMLGRFDGENYQIGAVDVKQTPYYDFVEGISVFNEAMYEIADGTRAPFDTVPKELPRIAY